MVPASEGTFFWVLTHKHEDWLTNDNEYRFPAGFNASGIRVRAIKTQQGTVRCTVEVGDEEYSYVGSGLSAKHPDGLPVVVRWTPDWIDMSLGELSLPRQSRRT